MRKPRHIAFRYSFLTFLPHFVPLAVIAEGDRICESRRFHTRQRSNSFAKLAVKTLASGFIKSQLLHVHRQIQNVIGIEPHVELLSTVQAAEKKRRNNQD